MLLELRFHSEYLGLLALMLFVLAIVVSLLFNPLGFVFERLFGYAIARIDEVTPESEKIEISLNRKLWRAEGDTRARVFKIACACFIGACVLNLFVVPASSPVHVEDDWSFALAGTLCAGAALVCFVGPVFFDRARAWKKWSFWVAAISSLALFLWIFHALLDFRVRRGGALLIPLLAGSVVFFYVFAVLRHIDRTSNVDDFEQMIARQCVVPPAREKRKRINEERSSS